MMRWYAPLTPLTIEPGEFTIWVFAAEKNHLSGCAWEIRRSSGGALCSAPDALVTEREMSTHWRGHLAAATRGLQQLPRNSHGVLCSIHTSFLGMINNIPAHRKNGWRKKDGTPLSDLDIVLELEQTLQARSVSTADPEGEQDMFILNGLYYKVHEALDTRIRQLRKKRHHLFLSGLPAFPY